MKRLGKRVADFLWRSYGNSLLEGLVGMGRDDGLRVLHHSINLEYRCVPYCIEEFHFNFNNKRTVWDALLKGITLPAHPFNHYYRLLSKRIMFDLAHAALVSKEGEKSVSFSASDYCFFDIGPYNITPRMRGNDFSAVDDRAHKTIDQFINFKEGLSKVSVFMRNEYPCSFEDTNSILKTAHNQFGLSFLHLS